MVTTFDPSTIDAHNAPLLDEDTLILQPRKRRHSRITEFKRVEIRVPGGKKYLTLLTGKPVVLGRADPAQDIYPDIDLTGVNDFGQIAHQHAKLLLYHGHVFVIDLPNSSGTYKSGRRLMPHDPELLDDGDAIVLGGLPIQIRFTKS